jgi:4-hydroxy-2-oxoheptanedioate aldolase
MTTFTLARRLRAGETVFSAWCRLAMPALGEILARHGFTAVTFDQ